MKMQTYVKILCVSWFSASLPATLNDSDVRPEYTAMQWSGGFWRCEVVSSFVFHHFEFFLTSLLSENVFDVFLLCVWGLII